MMMIASAASNPTCNPFRSVTTHSDEGANGKTLGGLPSTGFAVDAEDKEKPLIASENIVLNSEATCKRGVLNEMITLLPSMDPNQVMELVMAREKLGSTGIGHGVALPHGRMPGLTQPAIVLLRHQAGVDFDAIDDQPVHIVLLLLVPGSDDKGHLDLLAKLARKLQNETLRQKILTADSSTAIANLFQA